MTSQSALDEGSWKNVAVSKNTLNPDGVSQSGFPQTGLQYGNSASSQYPQTDQSSPAAGNQSGSNTPHYTSSPAPSGSSTPGPVGQQNSSGTYAQSSNSGNFCGSVGRPFGSPSSDLGQFSRPASSGISSFNSGQGGHFSSQAAFGQFNAMPISSSFSHGGGHSNMGAAGGPQQMERMEQGVRRQNSCFSQTENRVFELNKRLQQRTEDSDNCWWDAFTTEFFEDDARLTIMFCLDDGPKRYTIGRALIPRFFRSIYEGGVSDLFFLLKHAKESFHNTSITLDCDQCTVITQHVKPFFTEVCADARLILEFRYDDYMRIKSWHLTIKGHHELIQRSVIGTALSPDRLHQLNRITKNITRSGMTNSTLNYLRLCVILEPMQELMSRHKSYALSPKDCLKTTLFEKWQHMVTPPGKKDTQRPAPKRRKRKGSNSGGVASSAKAPPATKRKRSPSGGKFSLSSQDMMTVGEPTLMGGEFGEEEDERPIARLENNQYDGPNAVKLENHSGFGHANSPMPGSNHWSIDRTEALPSSPDNIADLDIKSPIISQ